MINRTLIRIKVVQMLYSYYMTKNSKTMATIKKELQKSLDKSYELYNAIFKLIIELTDFQENELEEAKGKFLPTEKDLNPNMRFVNNGLVEKLRENETLQEYFEDNHITWTDNAIFMKLMLNKILNSDIYKEYMAMEKTDFKSDCHVWRELLKNVILPDDDLSEELEARSVYWNDDLEIVGQFAIKTIKRFEDEVENPLMPQFKDDEDREFAENLFEKTIEQKDESNALIDKFVKDERWEPERIALMDRIVMCVAITEAQCYAEIPTRVTLNEYIEIAKSYSTRKSGQFVNGILNTVFHHLKTTGKMFKN